MMKKTIALLLTVLTVMGCAFCAFAADGDATEPAASPSGYTDGQILKVGDEIRSSFEECGSLTVIYSVSAEDAESVTSAWQAKFSDESIRGVASFRDIAYKASEDFKGFLTVKGSGDTVAELEVANGEFKSATNIYTSLSKDELKALGIRKQFTLTIDYDYAHTTKNQYTTVNSWKIVSIRDDETALELQLEAVFETREPTSFESFQEKLFNAWNAFLDKIGDRLLIIVPKLIAFLARILGKKS